MEPEIVEQIALMLLSAGEHRRLIPYQRFHALFDEREPLARRYVALEKAVARLADTSGVDYGALLTLSNGLAGAEFFTRFKRNRFDEYLAAVGNRVHERSLKRKRVLVEAERARVFEDAAQHRSASASEAA